MSAEDDDPVKKRAEEILAESASSAQRRDSQDADVRAERTRFVRLYLDRLTEKTSHAVECTEADVRAHGAVARFAFLKDGKSWTQSMFEFGIDRIHDQNGKREFGYYLLPATSAFAIPNPQIGVARELRDSPADAVLDYALAISIEMMARVIASGGMLGSSLELDAVLVQQEQSATHRARMARQERGRKFWKGCGVAILWFFGVVIGIGLLGNLLRGCSG